MSSKTAVCQECGKLFVIQPGPSGRYGRPKFCYDDHYRTCVICGKSFLVPRDKLPSKSAPTCSLECLNKAKGRLAQSSFKNKNKDSRICELCGKPFTPHSTGQRFCNRDHYLKCPICGEMFLAKRHQLSLKDVTCSEECSRIKSLKTYNSHYNKDENPEAHAALIAKIEATNLERHGYRNALDKQGRELSGAASAFYAKYGAYHPGDVPEIMEKARQTCLDKYGSVCALSDPEVKEKSKQTCLDKYGVDNYAKTQKFLSQVITDPDKASKCIEFKADPEQFISTYFPEGHKPTLMELSEMCGMRDSSIGYILDQHGHPDIIAYTYSRMEDELYRFLREELGESAEIQRNTFKIITPYELDIYLPEYNFAIECNPTVTHNSTLGGWSTNDEPKSTQYHKMKTDLCEEQGIFLFHIFGYEWTHRKEIVKSMLRNILNTSPNKIFARNTLIKIVSDNEAMNFLNDNHRQGGAHSSIRLGLVDSSDELVALMTFSKMRKTIGTGKANLDNCFELVRFCNKLNTNVVGGASKLFKHFLKTYNPEEVRSFSDRAHTKGTMYEKLGFKYDHTSDPGYMWVDLKTDKGYARNNAQKQNLKRFLNDETIDLTKTETQIMAEHNFVQVFDSGIKLWIYKKGEQNL